MEQTMNQDEQRDEAEGSGSWRPIGALAGSWADRIAVVRMARAAGEPAADLAARLGLAAE
jgi:hypothetical protein